MAVCALGVFVTSSCTKDEFFGLEDSVVIDASTKYEIAMSQEFAEYAKASLCFLDELNQPIDTTEKKVYCVIEDKPVYIKTGTSSYQEVLESLESLKKVFPELNKADEYDYDEILMIALRNNDALNSYMTESLPKETKASMYYNARSWFAQLLNIGGDFYCDGDLSSMMGEQYGTTWYMCAWWNKVSTINHAISLSQEAHVTTGGFFWNDGSGTSIISAQSEADMMPWPRFATYGMLTPEADFMIRPNGNLALPESNIGENYFHTGRVHYIYNYEGQYAVYY